MAFNQQQTKRAQAIIVVVALVAVIILAVVVLSGSLAPKASSIQNGSATSENTASSTASSSTAASSTSASSSTSEGSMEDTDATYGTAAKQLEAKYEVDKSNPSALLNLANGYFDWGAAAMNYAHTDDDNQHVKDLFTKAVGYYDTYLEQNPGSKSVIVDRAISVFYTGDHATAIQALESFTASDDNASFAPAWANLGMFYETDGQTDKAKAAYQKAVDADANNTYQVKSYAQQHLDALNQ